MAEKRMVLVTGASTGIGAATARDLAQDGGHVFVHYMSSKDAAESVAEEIRERGADATTAQADLTTDEGCQKLFAEVEQNTDRLDVVVNNAGGLVERRAVADFTWDVMTRVFALNTFSAMRVCSLAIPFLKKSSTAVVVNVSSIVVRHGAAGATLYGAAKGALDVFTRGMAKELAPAIRVAAVAPGVIETPFHDKVSTPEMLAKWAQSAPVGRNGSPQEIAHAIRFIIENGFVTGETLDVNGGMFMR